MFAELRTKTNFSFLEGASRPEEMIEHAANIGLSAVAVTDINGVYGIPKAYWCVRNFPQIKLIVGAQITLDAHPGITLLAKDRAAYGLMCRILTQAHAGKEKGKASLSLAALNDLVMDNASAGLFCLPDKGSDYAWLKSLFAKKIFIPISRFCDGYDRERVSNALNEAKTFDLPIVATNDVLFHSKDRKRLQDVFTCVRAGSTLLNAGYKLNANAERYLKSPLEMRLLFKDMPHAIENALLIADACTFSPKELRYRYPSEWIPENHTAQSYLEELTWSGAKERYRGNITENVKNQLVHELDLIKKLSFADYFLTVFDIVSFARKKDILCQGRGSAANSAVCYCLGITAIDPIRGKLLFERFLSLERHEPPDIDVDFEHDRREEVIQYIYEKYGRDRAAMVSAVVTYQSRSAFREISKAFGINVGAISAKKLLKNFEEYEKQSPIPNCREQIQILAEEMTGFPRHISIHSGGFTLSADPITEIVPVEPARMPGRTIIQWDKNDLDYLGLTKVDILGLGWLSAQNMIQKMVGLQLHEIPAEDAATYKMIQSADTVGTFQLESRAQMNMCGRLLPSTFYDLVIQLAMVRPGPSVGDMVHPFIRRRRGTEAVNFPHPKLREILSKTLGVPLFQEQLMKIAIDLGGFTPGESDYFRRAIGGWRTSGSIQKVAEKLLIGLRNHGVPEEYCNNLLRHMQGFAHYGFPESHSASFALLAYSSCYLKCHYPAEFACGLLNAQPMGFYASHTILDDAKRRGVRVLPLDPNKSSWNYHMEDGAIRVGLRSVFGIRKTDAEQILLQRPFYSLSDFLVRTNLRVDVLHRLALGDAFSCFGEDRRHTLWKVLSYRIQKTTQQLDLFLNLSFDYRVGNYFDKPSDFDAIKFDYNAFGLSTREHPMAALRREKKLPAATTAIVKGMSEKKFVKTSGLVLVRQRPPTANGVCFATIEDEYGFLDLVIFKKPFERFRDVFLHQCFLIVSGRLERDGQSLSMIVTSLESLWTETEKENTDLSIEPSQYF